MSYGRIFKYVIVRYEAVFDIGPDHPLSVRLDIGGVRLKPDTYLVSTVAIRQHDGVPFDRVTNPLRFEILPVFIDSSLPEAKRGLLTPPQVDWMRN